MFFEVTLGHLIQFILCCKVLPLSSNKLFYRATLTYVTHRLSPKTVILLYVSQIILLLFQWKDELFLAISCSTYITSRRGLYRMMVLWHFLTCTYPAFRSYPQGSALVYYCIKLSSLVTYMQGFKSLERLVPVSMDFHSWHCLSTDTEDRWLHEGRHLGRCVRKKAPGITDYQSFPPLAV